MTARRANNKELEEKVQAIEGAEVVEEAKVEEAKREKKAKLVHYQMTGGTLCGLALSGRELTEDAALVTCANCLNKLNPKEKKAKAKAEPVWVEQKGFDGEIEKVDSNIYSIPITCKICGEIRYIRKSDGNVDRCKPHVQAARKAKQRAKNKDRRKRKHQAEMGKNESLVVPFLQDFIDTLAGYPDDQKHNMVLAAIRVLKSA